MTANPEPDAPSLVELIETATPLVPSAPPPPERPGERRARNRFRPERPLTLRLDVRGGIWSAQVADVARDSACLHVDREVAPLIDEEQPAALWVESVEGERVRLEGSLRLLRDPTGPGTPAGVSFVPTLHAPALT